MYVHGEVTLTDRSVVETVVHNGVAIISTANNDVILDVSAFADKKDIFIVNLLDQAITITIHAMSQTGSSFVTLGTPKSVPTTTSALISSSDAGYGALADPLKRIRIRAAAATAPTSGTLTTYLEGSQK